MNPSPHPLRYRGHRSPFAVVELQRPDGTWSPLPSRRDLHDHSPTGFEWGYGGSGPAQLALALAASRLLDWEALAIYQDLKRALVANFEGNEWQLEGAQLDELLGELRAAAGALLEEGR